MRVIYHSRHKAVNAPTDCEYFENVEEMLAQADVLSVHVPLREDTIHLVGEKWIRALKPGAIIINTARGKVIDEEAMIKALEDGHVCQFVSLDLQKLIIPLISSRPSVWMSSQTSLKLILAFSNFLKSHSCHIWVPRIRIHNGRWKSELSRI